MNEMVKYEAAVEALSACSSTDEVADWVDKSSAIQAYGRMSKNKGVELMGAKIRLRATRQLGLLMAKQKEAGGLKEGRPENGSETNPFHKSLESQGIGKRLADSARKLAAVDSDDFEFAIGDWEKRSAEDGARVFANLEANGAKTISEDENVAGDDYDPAAEYASDHEAMLKIIEADDKLAAAMAELRAARRIHEATTRLYEAKCAEVETMKREATRWMKKAKKSAACQDCMTALERE